MEHKKIISMVLSAILVFLCGSTSFAFDNKAMEQSQIYPRFQNIVSFIVGIEDEGSKVEASFTARINSGCTGRVVLQVQYQKENGTWETIKSKTYDITGNKTYTEGFESDTLSSGYDYRIKGYIYVYPNSGGTETSSDVSMTVSK